MLGKLPVHAVRKWAPALAGSRLVRRPYAADPDIR